MKPAADTVERRDRIIASLLRHGTWLASALIAIGMALAAFAPPPIALDSPGLVRAGVATFILLPIARVGLMLTIFLRERDYVYALIAALVLAIVATGVVIEI